MVGGWELEKERDRKDWKDQDDLVCACLQTKENSYAYSEADLSSLPPSLFLHFLTAAHLSHVSLSGLSFFFLPFLFLWPLSCLSFLLASFAFM